MLRCSAILPKRASENPSICDGFKSQLDLLQAQGGPFIQFEACPFDEGEHVTDQRGRSGRNLRNGPFQLQPSLSDDEARTLHDPFGDAFKRDFTDGRSGQKL